MSLYDEFINDKQKGTLKSFDKITREELKQLFWNEQISNVMIAELFDVSRSKVYQKRRKWGLLLHDLSFQDFISNILRVDEETDKIAKAITIFAFRNGPVEDMHAEGKLSQEDMKTLNKFMVNRLAYVFNIFQNDKLLFDFLVSSNYNLQKIGMLPFPMMVV